MRLRKACILFTTLAMISCQSMGSKAPGITSDSSRGMNFSASGGEASGNRAEWAKLEASAGQAMYNTKSYMILNTSVEMSVKSFNESLAAVKKIIAENQGFVSTMESRKDDEGLVSGSVVVKIPADRYDEAMKRITKQGEVRFTEEKTEDVTQEFVDLTARLDNAKKLEQRILQLLETHTGKIEDIMNVEKELGAVREKIEEMEGRKRYLENKIQYSTITVRMYEKGAKFGGEMTPGDIFKEVVNKIGIIFVGSVGILVVVIVGVAPWVLLLGLLGLMIRGLVRRRRRKAASG